MSQFVETYLSYFLKNVMMETSKIWMVVHKDVLLSLDGHAQEMNVQRYVGMDLF